MFNAIRSWPSLRRLGSLVAAVCVARGASAQIERQSIETSDGLTYLLRLPNGHDPNQRWPLILFLHGFGERSVHNEPGKPLSGLTVHSMPAVVESRDWNWPFIVVSPQINDEGWITRADDLGRLIDRMQSKYGADPNRLYLTGLSYGGRGTWQVGLAQLQRWAALMPLCSNPGGLDAADRARLAKRPLFVVHGTEDPTGNDYPTMEAFIASFEKEGTPFYQFEYALSDQEKDHYPKAALSQRHVFARMMGYGHDVWTATYGGRNAARKTVSFDWLLAQSLDGSPFVDPRRPATGAAKTPSAATQPATSSAATKSAPTRKRAAPPAAPAPSPGTDSGCTLRSPGSSRKPAPWAPLLWGTLLAGLARWRTQSDAR